MVKTAERKLKDTISALMVSYFIIIIMLQATSRFLSIPTIVVTGVVSLILAVVFLFIIPSKKRTMRIISICCNSITIGCSIGLLFSALGLVMPVIHCIIISGLFIGFVFLVYYFIYVLNSRVISSIICGVVIVALGLIYYFTIMENTDDVYNYYIILFYVMTIIHYIIAICTTHSVKNSIITGMAYGYFGITIAVIVVVGIFLLLAASEGDLDLDIGGSGGEGKSSKVAASKKGVKVEPKDKSPKILDGTKSSARKAAMAASVVAENDSNADIAEDILYAASDILDLAALTVENTEVVVEDIKTMEELDKLYEEGKITYEEYKRLRKNIFGM